MIIERTSPYTGKVQQLELDITSEQMQWYINGTPMYKAFPHLTLAQREFIKNGILPGEVPEASEEDKAATRELYEEDVEYTANSLPDEAWHAQAAQYVREENLYAELGLIKIEEEQNITDQYEVEDSGEPDWDNIAKRQEQQKWESDCNPLIGGE
jgi:hypothetical protein